MRIPALFTILLLASACGSDQSDKSAVAPDTNAAEPLVPQEAVRQAEQALRQSADLQQPVEPVNFRKLKDLLPAKAAGYTRTDYSGQTAGAMGIKLSKAEGIYKNSAGKELLLKIVDTGGVGMGLMSMAAWSTITVDKEDSNGHERTGTLNGYKSFEKYRKSGESSEVALLVENRFIVTATCRGCGMETLRSVVQAVDLDKLKNSQ